MTEDSTIQIVTALSSLGANAIIGFITMEICGLLKVVVSWFAAYKMLSICIGKIKNSLENSYD